MLKLSALTHSLLSILVFAGLCWAQDIGSPYLARVERQTRQENVCMLVQKDGHYHLERTVAGGSRVFEGTLGSPALAEFEPLLNTQQIVDLKPSQIERTPVGEDLDQVMITIRRPTGWQTLTFPSGKSRKPFKSEMDPILNWLDRNKQQQNPIAGAASNRCMPPGNAQASGAKPSTSNPYMIRIVIDQYEPTGSGTTLSLDKGTAADKAPTLDSSALRLRRTCAVVYESGRYHFEKSIQESGSLVRSEIYRDTLDKGQLAGLRQILDNQKLATLPDNAAPAALGREGDVISLAVPREKGVQAISFASFFSPRTHEVVMQGNTSTLLSANIELTNPIRKWVKQNIEEHKGAQVKDVAASNCLPTAQPE